mgnify:CR=1 FL=1
MTIIAAADGSALGNPGPAGWAWYVDDGCWAAGGWPESTNNRGELTAVLELLRATAHTGEDLLVQADSQYVINSLTKWMKGWKRRGWRKADGKPVLNDDLMKALDAALAGRAVRFEWVRGHVGHPLNEAADSRARAAATAGRQPHPARHDRGEEPGRRDEPPAPQDTAALLITLLHQNPPVTVVRIPRTEVAARAPPNTFNTFLTSLSAPSPPRPMADRMSWPNTTNKAIAATAMAANVPIPRSLLSGAMTPSGTTGVSSRSPRSSAGSR